MGLSIMDVAPRDKTRTKVCTVVDSDGGAHKITVVYKPNRLTADPDPDPEGIDDETTEDGRQSLRNAAGFASFVAAWDLEGPVEDQAGNEVSPAGEPVILEPRVIRCVPTWIWTQIQTQITDDEFPNRNGSRAGRKRS